MFAEMWPWKFTFPTVNFTEPKNLACRLRYNVKYKEFCELQKKKCEQITN